MPAENTLKVAIDQGALGVTIYCRRCVHSKRFDAAHALELWGTLASFPEIARRARCSRCHQQAFEVAPDWPTKPNPNGPPTSGAPLGWA